MSVETWISLKSISKNPRLIGDCTREELKELLVAAKEIQKIGREVKGTPEETLFYSDAYEEGELEKLVSKLEKYLEEEMRLEESA